MAINDNFYQPPPPKIEEEVPQECKDRAYWHKRFNFASWLFLVFAIWAIFASSTLYSALIALIVSIGFRLLNSILEARHILWHIKRHGGGDECPKHKDEPIENDLLKALEDKQMSNYQFGVYANWNWKSPALGIGFNNFGEEKYLHISLLFLDVAIGKTGR